MPLNNEDLSAQSRQEFCLGLKAARERRGLSLARIAETTKIPASLFEALERNDLRRWPKGLFRRSFFRDYAGTIGLPVGEACNEFVRLFPDDEGAEVARVPEAADEANQAGEVRLTFDASWHGPRSSVLSRLLAVVIDAGAVMVVAAALTWVTGMDLAVTTAIIALTYFSLATAIFGESPARWAVSNRQSLLELFGSTDDATTEPVEEPESRTWITDARRVAPAQGLRVRIKVPQ